jgi:hypothetical protein
MSDTQATSSDNEEIDVLAQAQKLRQQTQVPNSTASAHEIHGEISGASKAQ